MGDSVSALMRRAHDSWKQYRKLACDAIRVAFAEGSMAPIAQMECWVALTNDRRRFLAEQYDYTRNARTTAGRPR